MQVTNADEVVVVDSPPPKKRRSSSRKAVELEVILIRLTGERVPVKIEANATIDQFKHAVQVLLRFIFRQEQKTFITSKAITS